MLQWWWYMNSKLLYLRVYRSSKGGKNYCLFSFLIIFFLSLSFFLPSLFSIFYFLSFSLFFLSLNPLLPPSWLNQWNHQTQSWNNEITTLFSLLCLGFTRMVVVMIGCGNLWWFIIIIIILKKIIFVVGYGCLCSGWWVAAILCLFVVVGFFF